MATGNFSVGSVQASWTGPAGPPLALVGRRTDLLDAAFLAQLDERLATRLPALVTGLSPDHRAATASLRLGANSDERFELAVLPEQSSRHGCPARSDEIHRVVRDVVGRPEGADDLRLLVACRDSDAALAATLAVARAFPAYSRKTRRTGFNTLRLGVSCADGSALSLERFQVAADAVRDAAHWVDMPACELHSEAFVAKAEALAADLGTRIEVWRGEQLERAGLGGLWGVGRAAARPPALVVLGHHPEGAQGPSTAWVGKGIVYDTGGLSLKSNAEMAGMKGDMAGAAAVLGAFSAAVQLGAPGPLYAVLCVAENAIGPHAMRPDDILTLYSGRTVEIRNTDCEGRLVLADGVAYAARRLDPERIIDLATLTDGAVVATGRRQAALVCNDAELEARAVAAGRATGELVHPLPYCPELSRDQLESKVADMTNAARDPSDANASTAAQFIANHLEGYTGGWLHVDLEGPARDEHGRATGFGVGLLLRLAEVL